MLVVHHLGVSQSERIVWLCEELGLDYDLKLHKRSPLLSPPEIKQLHPIGAAPIIQDGDLTLAESAACCEYIIHKHGKGRFVLPPSHKDYATYLYWYAFANGSLQPAISRMMSLKLAGIELKEGAVPEGQAGMVLNNFLKRQDALLTLMNDHLKTATWLAGDEFSAADIMTVFTLTTMRYFYQYDLSKYGAILQYLQRVAAREAYQRAMKKGDPGMTLVLEGPPPKPFGSA